MFSRLKCHFCGARSKYSRGTAEFQCDGCEAWNFYDQRGGVVDTPASFASAPQRQSPSTEASPSSSFPLRDTAQHTRGPPPAFCTNCLTNQRIYTESLANYLPDDDHPQYYEYERKLPRYKADLEKRYPQICKKCAPKAQHRIAEADRHGMTHNVAKNMRDTAARGGRPNKGQRDDWGKWSIRRLLGFLRLTVYASLLVQMAWHVQGGLATVSGSPVVDKLEFALVNPTLASCVGQTLLLRWDPSCFKLWAVLVPRALLMSLSLLWFNPGLRLWYHHTTRVESVSGRKQYFFIQLVLLAVRAYAWVWLSNGDTVSEFTTSQLLAAHGFTTVFLPLLQTYSERSIDFQAWRIKGKMMKRPEEGDVLGAYAAPAREVSPPQASSMPPLRLFARDNRPFPMQNLASLAPNPRGLSALDQRHQVPPSPPDSQSTSEDGHEDQMDWQPSIKQQMPGAEIDRTWRPKNTRSANRQPKQPYTYGMIQGKQRAGWEDMRNEIFGMHSEVKENGERRRTEQEERARIAFQPQHDPSPFRGTLPPAPISMERKLRNPPAYMQPQKQREKEEQIFKKQLRDSYGPGLGGKSAFASKKNISFSKGLSLNDDDEEDEDLSPAKSRARSSLVKRDSGWRLASDLTKQSTGLEDLFGGHSFRIHDEPGARVTEGTARAMLKSWPWKWLFAVIFPVLMAAVGWSVVPVRRAVCLFLAGKLETMGY